MCHIRVRSKLVSFAKDVVLCNTQNILTFIAHAGPMTKSLMEINILRKELAGLADISKMQELGPLGRKAVKETMLRKAFELQEALA